LAILRFFKNSTQFQDTSIRRNFVGIRAFLQRYLNQPKSIDVLRTRASRYHRRASQGCCATGIIGDPMSKKNGTRAGLADPSRLKPIDSDDKQMLRVVIETPKGSRNKFAFDPEDHVFELKKVLPAGMTFPYDFGFVPSTQADDGDPVDVLVLMDEPAFAGCLAGRTSKPSMI
jgi:hypothetical protein